MTTSEQNHIATVQAMYAAFGRGDVETILQHLAPNVEWDYDIFPNPAPWLQPLKGRDQVPKFFQALQEGLEITQFQPRHFFSEGPVVVTLLDVSCRVRATGIQIPGDDEVHIFRFNAQGQVQSFRHRIDTWQMMQAMRAD